MDWLPDVAKDYHQRSFPWAERTDPKGCLHTTESSSWPEYRGWTVMPHATVRPIAGKGVEVRQHLPFSQGSFALRHTRSQPTNGDYVFQFELIGTSEKGGPGLFWPDADDAVLLDLYKKVIKPLDAGFVIPFRALAFKAYPDSYGTNNGVRLNDTQFDTYSGWLGHQHVPQNDHGDPGHFPWDRLVKLAGGVDPKPPHPPAIQPLHGPLQYGSHGTDVRRLQHRLNKQLGVDIAEDGDFGRATQREVIAWQRKHHLGQDGIVGPATAKSLGFSYTTR